MSKKQKLICAMYLRKSRADSDVDTVEETLTRHEEILKEFLTHHPELELKRTYKDVVSGDSIYARPQMLELMQDIEAGLYNAVLCMDIDRLGRGATSEQGFILETFKINNIKIITPRKVYDLNNELDEEYAEFESFMARRELKLIKRRLHTGTLKSISEGCHLCVPPYGYARDYKDKKSTLKIVEDEAKFVRIIFDMYCSGIGAATIAETISNMGAVPHRSDKFCRTSIIKIIKNPNYIGKIVWNTKKSIKKGQNGAKKNYVIYNPQDQWKIVDGLHPPIISEDVFYKANEILKSRYRKPYQDGKLLNPLSQILRCRVCGEFMQRRPYKDRKEPEHLLCPTKGCCCSSRLDRVEMAVIDAVEKKLNELKSNKYNPPKHKDYSAMISSLEHELNTLKNQSERLHDFLEKGVYDIDTFLERRDKLQNRIEQVQDQLITLKEKNKENNNIDIEEIIKQFENVLNLYWDSTPDSQNKLLNSIIDGGTYYKEKGWKPNQFIIKLRFKNC